MIKIILASASPRRRKLLKKIIPVFSIRKSNFNEEEFIKKFKNPRELVKKLAWEKVKAVLQKKEKKESLVIGADTIGVLGKRILGKPKDREEAKEMLKLLKGKTHKILTGIVVLETISKKQKSFVEETRVTFKNFSETDLKKFLDSGDWQDKAASYAIQSKNFDFLKGIKGDYDNVVGLPLKRLAFILKEFGVC